MVWWPQWIVFIFHSDGPKEESYRRIFKFKSFVPSNSSILCSGSKWRKTRQKSAVYQNTVLAQFSETLGPGRKADERWLSLFDTINETLISTTWDSLDCIACWPCCAVWELCWRSMDGASWPPRSRWSGSGSSFLSCSVNRLQELHLSTSELLLFLQRHFDS